MPVLITRRAPGSSPVSVRAVAAMARVMLAELELGTSELSILLTSDEGIRLLNREHRGKDRPTDVLSFPQNEFRRPLVPRRGQNLAVLGDVILSIDTAARQARGRRRPLLDEIRFLLAHGLLHLLGYDHATLEEKKVMTARTRALVRACSRSSSPSASEIPS
jgi:probable rRNA maturation factor